MDSCWLVWPHLVRSNRDGLSPLEGPSCGPVMSSTGTEEGRQPSVRRRSAPDRSSCEADVCFEDTYHDMNTVLLKMSSQERSPKGPNTPPPWSRLLLAVSCRVQRTRVMNLMHPSRAESELSIVRNGRSCVTVDYLWTRVDDPTHDVLSYSSHTSSFRPDWLTVWGAL